MDQDDKPSSPNGRGKGLEEKDLYSRKATSRLDGPREEEPQVNRAGPPQLFRCRDLIYVRDGHPLQRIGIQAGVEGSSGTGMTVSTDGGSFISEGAGTQNTCRMQGTDGKAPASTRHHQPSSTNRPSTSRAWGVECDFCQAGPFSNHAQMCEHVSQVHVVTTPNAENDTWSICICGKALFSDADLYNHSLTAQNSDEICGECKGMFRSKMVEYQRKHFQMYEYKCPRCLDRFKTADLLQNHWCDCIRVPPYAQPKPGTTKSGLNVKGTRDSNYINKKYTCGVEGCPLKPGVKRIIHVHRKHCRNYHNFDPFEFKCRCPRRFSTINELLFHMQECLFVYRPKRCDPPSEEVDELDGTPKRNSKKSKKCAGDSSLSTPARMTTATKTSAEDACSKSSRDRMPGSQSSSPSKNMKKCDGTSKTNSRKSNKCAEGSSLSTPASMTTPTKTSVVDACSESSRDHMTGSQNSSPSKNTAMKRTTDGAHLETSPDHIPPKKISNFSIDKILKNPDS